MKKRKVQRLLAGLLAAGLAVPTAPIPVWAEEVVQEEAQNAEDSFFQEDTPAVLDLSEEEDTDEIERPQGEGWQETDGFWYYFDKQGILQKGWLLLDGKYYYCNPQTGAMETGWITVGNTKYLLQDNGVMMTGWLEVGDTWYYFKDWGGLAVSQWFLYNNNWYYAGADGLIVKGWQDIGKNRFYFKDWGGLAVGWYRVDGTWYYIDKNKGLQKNRWFGSYYVTADGSMAVNRWIGNYYVDENGKWVPGKKQYAWVKDGSSWRYQKSDGSYAVSKWVDKTGAISDTAAKGSYYVDKYGKMVQGEGYSIGNYIYQFDANGKCTGWEDRYVKAIDPKNGKSYTLEKQYQTDPQLGKEISERDLLAAITYREAGNQGVDGMTAVALVILNRMESKSFPDSMNFVLYQKGQFEVARNNQLTTMLESIRDKSGDTWKLLQKYHVYDAVDDALAIMKAYKKDSEKNPRVIEGVELPEGKEDFDYLFFMTPAAFNASNLDPEKCDYMQHKGHSFFVNFVYKTLGKAVTLEVE